MCRLKVNGGITGCCKLVKDQLLLAESDLTRWLFGSMVRRIAALAVPTTWPLVDENLAEEEGWIARCPSNQLKMRQFPVFACSEEAGMSFNGRRSRSEKKGR